MSKMTNTFCIPLMSIVGKLIARPTALESGACHEEEIAKNVGPVALEAGTDTVRIPSTRPHLPVPQIAQQHPAAQIDA